MSAINFNTSNQTFRQLLGNGLVYRVPRFQRDYSWTQDEWDDLWQDLQAVERRDEPAHYLGYLVLQTNDNKSFDVIDGQQRLTTLSLLVLAVLAEIQTLVEAGIEAENNRRRIEQLRSAFIGFLDPVTLVPQNKLALNRNNDGYYRDYLVPLLKLPQRGLRTSERLLRKSFEWFAQKVHETYGVERKGSALAKFVEGIADRVFFTVISVTDELNAFKVFETLNARGVRLSPTDLLKNYLFSVVHRESAHASEIDALERRWEGMVGRLGGESFPAFLRAHWNSRRKFVREADLFKTIRAETPDRARVFELIREMEQDVAVYVALTNPEDPLWTNDQRPHVRELRMFSVRQPWPLLLAAHRAFDEDEFRAVLRACSVIAFRYNVIGGLATNEQERVYNDVARKVAAQSLTSAAAAIRGLSAVYLADTPFRQAFAEKAIRTTFARNRHVVRYLLFCLERHLTGQEYDLDSAQYTLEHVLPENPAQMWPGMTEAQADEFVYRLGNLTLLDPKTNRELGNAGFAEKTAAYAQSPLKITQRIASENEDWTIERIAERQRWMARQATSIWQVSQLGSDRVASGDAG